MAEEFENRDLDDAVFWGVSLQRAMFRDVDLTGLRVTSARLVDVVIDAEVDGLVVNGVDVTAYVHANDPWYPLRSKVRPLEVADLRPGWQVFSTAWGEAIDRVRGLPDATRHASVDGEWSFVETLRHLVFATDKWFTVPVLGTTFHALGMPNTGSIDLPWPGLERGAAASFDDVVAAWSDRSGKLHEYLEEFDPASWDAEVEILENGTTPVHDCIGVVFEEHFEHLRYALRDLERLA
jgi:hypothetical protein